jgi:hypothetical protein
MTEPPSEEDVKLWRRKLGSEANNRGWALAEKTSRTSDEDAEMLHAAHASRYLWSKIGTERNFALADLLLGQVHALLGHARTATVYAEKAFAYFTSRQSEPWEVAFAYAIQASAAAASGNRALYSESYARALEIANTLADPEDRRIFDATFNVIPKPADAEPLAQADASLAALKRRIVT